MKSKEAAVSDYVGSLPADRKAPVEKLLDVLRKSLPKGFRETMSGTMPAFVVPHDRYPEGYHCKPETPLPFICLASQKNFIAPYHMGLYADQKLLKWFTTEYPKHSHAKLDMGKSCIRFKKPDQIPFKLIGELATKMSVDEWIALYERNLKR